MLPTSLMSPLFLFWTGLLWMVSGTLVLGLRAHLLTAQQLKNRLLGISFVPGFLLLACGTLIMFTASSR